MITIYDENGVRIRDVFAYEVNTADMGESTISCETSLTRGDNEFHPDWHVIYNGEVYRLGVRKPSGKKDTNSFDTKFSLVFHSSRDYLKNFTFMNFVDYGTGNPQPSTHTFSLAGCTLPQFISIFNLNLNHYLPGKWRMELSNDYHNTGEQKTLSFDRVSLWNVLIDTYQNWGARWTIKPVVEDEETVMVITIGADPVTLDTTLEYGKDNGLVSIERNNPQEQIVSRLRGYGASKNIPTTYFHEGDPDTNNITQGIFYNRLLPKSYRDYIRGYNSGESSESETWAYNQGAQDAAEHRPMKPIDFVRSENEEENGISYGAIEDNESIYPTFQGATRNGIRIDDVLKVEQVDVDSPDDEKEAVFTKFNDDITGQRIGRDTSISVGGSDGGIKSILGYNNRHVITLNPTSFTLAKAYNTVKTNLSMVLTHFQDFYAANRGYSGPANPTAISIPDSEKFVVTTTVVLKKGGVTVDTQTFNQHNFLDLQWEDLSAGTYSLEIDIVWYANEGFATDGLKDTLEYYLYNMKVAQFNSAAEKKPFKETFDIWVRNIWNTTKGDNETPEDYAFRVWSELATIEEMVVQFSDGLLAGEDYDFRVAGFTTGDDLRSAIVAAIKWCDPEDEDYVEGSHWKISLQKSDAEYAASGKYLPNRVINAIPGDHFFFLNIEMPYDPYVYDAEAELEAYLDEQLALLDKEFPSFTVQPSSVFCGTFAEVDKLVPGNKIAVRNLALIGEDAQSFYIQSVALRYQENALWPEWSLVITDEVTVNGNAISVLEGKVNDLTRLSQGNRASTKAILGALASQFLFKNGQPDVSISPTTFNKEVKLGAELVDKIFRRGDMAGQGQGFGVYTDSDGNRVVETDILVGRMALRLNEIIVNQVDYVGGRKIYSAAAMTVSKVESTGTVWRCYFDSKQGTVRNMFLVGDYAFCQRFKGTEEGGYTTYWVKITAIGSDYIEISKTDKMSGGSGSPSEGDNIVQLGNVSDVDRQSAIIMSSYGDNSPSMRMYHGIDQYSLASKDIFGVEYDAEREQPHFFNYGSMWLGSRPDSAENVGYIMFDPVNGLNIVVNGANLKDADGTTWASKFKNLQDQIDGTVESWFKENDTPDVEYIPAPNDDVSSYNYPASEWIFSLYAWVGTDGFHYYTKSVTPSPSDSVYNSEGVTLITVSITSYSGSTLHIVKNGEAINATRSSSYDTQADSKEAHINDTFTNMTTGRSWRWVRVGNPPYTYKWVEITDTATSEALRKAAEAKDIADGKRRTFLSQPTTAQAYDVGDIWVNATYGNTYKNEVLVCATAKASGASFSINHWKKADNYTTSATLTATRDSILASVASGYAAKGDLNDYLQITAAASRYATKTALNRYLPTTSFGSYFSSAVEANNIANYDAIAQAYYNKTQTESIIEGAVSGMVTQDTFATVFSQKILTVNDKITNIPQVAISNANLLVGEDGKNSFSALYSSYTDAALGTDGKISQAINTATAGMITSTGTGGNSFATLFASSVSSEGLAKNSEIAVWAGGGKSGLKLSASEINFIGKTIINNNFVVDNSGNVKLYGGIQAMRPITTESGVDYVLYAIGNSKLIGSIYSVATSGSHTLQAPTVNITATGSSGLTLYGTSKIDIVSSLINLEGKLSLLVRNISSGTSFYLSLYSGYHYFICTQSSALTFNLGSGSSGQIIFVKQCGEKVTLSGSIRKGSQTVSTYAIGNGKTAILVYVDSQWSLTLSSSI